MTADGFTVDLTTITTLSNLFRTQGHDLAAAFATWQTGADALRSGLAGLDTSVGTDVLGACTARQILTLAGLAAWSAELLAWWDSMAATDISNADDFALDGGFALPSTPSALAQQLGSGGDELRR